MILKWIIKGRMILHGLDLSVTGQGKVAGCCEHGDEYLSFIKYVEFFDWLRNFGLLKNDRALWSD
jgi:hypothetical protein